MFVSSFYFGLVFSQELEEYKKSEDQRKHLKRKLEDIQQSVGIADAFTPITKRILNESPAPLSIQKKLGLEAYVSVVYTLVAENLNFA